VLSLIGSTEAGLTEAEVLARQREYGPNQFTEAREEGFVVRLARQLRSPLIFVLLVAMLLTVALEEYIDAGVILFALAIAVAVGLWQEGGASRAFKTLASSQVPTAIVIRDGAQHEVPARALVPGDIVEIKNGMQVPADLRLVHTKELSVNEAALTGEWLAVGKQEAPVAVGTALSEQASMAWMGTFVAEGYGLGVVIRTGDQTAIGEVASDLNHIKDEETPLQSEMRRISLIMLYIILALVVLIFGLGLWHAYSLNEMLLIAIAISVASIPEGLPAAITIVLAVGMETLLRRGGLVRNLLAAETLGSTTYVLTDKTGTLTEAKMTLMGVAHDGITNVDPGSWASEKHVRHTLDVALGATESFMDQTNGVAVPRGNPVERAILLAAESVGLTPQYDSLRSARTDLFPFASENRFSAGLVETAAGPALCINGAPELLLSQATALAGADGQTIPLSTTQREEYAALIREHTKSGRRLVAVAHKPVTYDAIPEHVEEPTSLIQDCVFLGILIFNDPVRAGVPEAIAGVQAAGAKVILVTGDNPETALSIARATGIAGASESAIVGDEITAFSDEELYDIMEYVHVFARVLPRQKLRIARVLQRHGEIVAMTGDGINDAPALKKANIGVAIGSGTAVAKESSDLVLVNDTFATIYAAIEEGRRIINNLRKIVGYLFSTALSEVLLISSALIMGVPIPLLPSQIIWANIIEEGLMSVAFAFEPGDKNAMKERPHDIHAEGILSPTMIWFMAFIVSVLGMMSVALFIYLRLLELPEHIINSAMFVSIAADSLFLAFAFRSLRVPFWRIPLNTNRFFLGSFIVSGGLMVLSFTVPFLQNMLSYTPLPTDLLVLVLAISAVGLLVIELSKWLFFGRALHARG
jgi:Ca2+-transporting ATPase